MRQALLGAILALLLVAGGALAAIWSGHVPVAAATAEPPLMSRLLHTAYERTVARAAADVAVPQDLLSPERIGRGAYNFDVMCAGCHTPPGQQRSVQVRGMQPQPPRLAALAAERSPAEAYWVIDNGVRMTAMPAFGPSHEADELWALVAFLQQAEHMSATGYREAVTQARARQGGGDGHDHSHGPSDHQDDGAGQDDDAGQAGGTIADQLRAALTAGDAQAVQGLLAPDVLIFESGGMEQGFAEYAGHHLPADMAFLREMQHELLSRRRFEFGEHAVLASRSRVHGDYKGKALDLVSTETLLLERVGEDDWRIAHIHWSSGPVR